MKNVCTEPAGRSRIPSSRRQLRASEQAAHPPERARRHEQVLADDAPVLAGQADAT